MTATDRPDRSRMLSTRVVVALLVLLVLVLTVAVLTRRSSVTTPDPEVVLTIPVGQVAGGVALEDSIVVAISEETGVFEGRTELVRLDAVTGAELERVELADASTVEGMAVVDGDAVLRLRGRVPGVLGVLVTPTRWLDVPRVPGEFWLTVVDGETLEARQQYRLTPHDWGSSDELYPHEPLVVFDGVYWMPGAGIVGARARIDVRSGEAWIAMDVWDRPVLDVFPWRDRMVIVTASQVRVEDVATTEIIDRFDKDTFTRIVVEPSDNIAFRAHENQVWATNIWEPQDGFPLRLDLESGELVEDQPSTTIPAAAFTSGGHRWELLRDFPVAPFHYRPSPVPGDRWRWVDPTTHEVLDTFDLGGWRPMFATPDHLWVTIERQEGPGLELARIPLDPDGRGD